MRDEKIIMSISNQNNTIMDCSIRTSSDVLMFSSTIIVPSSIYYSSKNQSCNSNINVDVDDSSSKTKESENINDNSNNNNNNNNAAFDAFPQSGNMYNFNSHN